MIRPLTLPARHLALVAAAIILGLLALMLVLLTGEASAMPNQWYRCWVPDYGEMWCLDV